MKNQIDFLVLLLTILILSSLPNKLNSQNLVANGGFEDVNSCVEFNAKCAPEAWFRIPPTDVNVITKKVSRVFDGDYSEIIVVENKNHPKTYRVFLYTMLLCPLIQNQEYTLSFYLNSIYQPNYELGILFSTEELITGLVNPLDFKPSIKVTGGLIKKKKKKEQWQFIEINYKANGGEKFITLGNFNSTPYIFTKKDKPNNSQGDLIYLIDNISLIPNNPNSEDLCDIEESTKLLYDSNYRHTYKKGVEKKTEIIMDINKPIPLIETEQVQPITEIELKKKIEISDIVFDFDKYTIRNNSRNLLDSIIMTIKDYHPNEIEIIGHTDSYGSEQYNLELSIKRAMSIELYLLNGYPSYLGKIESKGKGEAEFKVDNSTEENRMKNRRVEIILKKYPDG